MRFRHSMYLIFLRTSVFKGANGCSGVCRRENGAFFGMVIFRGLIYCALFFDDLFFVLFLMSS